MSNVVGGDDHFVAIGYEECSLGSKDHIGIQVLIVRGPASSRMILLIGEQ